MENFGKVIKEVILQLINIKYTDGDIGDVGNEIGIAIGKCLDENNTLNDFIKGIKHGVSLVNGTH